MTQDKSSTEALEAASAAALNRTAGGVVRGLLPDARRRARPPRRFCAGGKRLRSTWGDVLVTQGRTKEALAKYDEALKYAPTWVALKEARDAVAKQTHSI